MKGQRLLLSFQEYSFVNDDGEKVEGATAFIVSDKLQGENAKGYRVSKFSLSKDKAKKLEGKPVPCLVDCEFNLGVDNQQRPKLNLLDIEFNKKFDLGI